MKTQQPQTFGTGSRPDTLRSNGNERELRRNPTPSETSVQHALGLFAIAVKAVGAAPAPCPVSARERRYRVLTVGASPLEVANLNPSA